MLASAAEHDLPSLPEFSEMKTAAGMATAVGIAGWLRRLRDCILLTHTADAAPSDCGRCRSRVKPYRGAALRSAASALTSAAPRNP